MSSRLLIVLVALGVLATGGGVAGGLLLARDPGPDPAVAGPTTLPATTLPPEPSTTTSTSSTTTTSAASTTSATAGLVVRASLVERAEDGLVVSYQATEPVAAVLDWGVGEPEGNRLRFPGPAAQGTVKLVLTETTSAVSMRVTGQAADGRTDSSRTLTARRLLRQAVVEVRSLTLDIPSGTGGIATTFRGSTVTPIGPSATGPTASAAPYAFPATVLEAGEQAGTLTLRFVSRVPPAAQRTRQVSLTVPFPGTGASTLTRDVTAIGLTAHLRVRVTAVRG